MTTPGKGNGDVMANMSYCRFENTLRDLQDCHEHMDREDLSDGEGRCRSDLVQLCCDVALEHGGDFIDGSASCTL